MLHWWRWDVKEIQNNGEGRVLVSKNNFFFFLENKK